MFWIIGKLSRMLPLDTASRFGNKLCTFIGPYLKQKNTIFHSNMAIAFPELSEPERQQLIIKTWGQSGRLLAEYLHLDTILKETDRISINIHGTVPTYSDPTKASVEAGRELLAASAAVYVEMVKEALG